MNDETSLDKKLNDVKWGVKDTMLGTLVSTGTVSGSIRSGFDSLSYLAEGNINMGNSYLLLTVCLSIMSLFCFYETYKSYKSVIENFELTKH